MPEQKITEIASKIRYIMKITTSATDLKPLQAPAIKPNTEILNGKRQRKNLISVIFFLTILSSFNLLLLKISGLSFIN